MKEVDFQGSRAASNGGLILVREMDVRRGLGELIEQQLSGSRPVKCLWNALERQDFPVLDSPATQELRLAGAKTAPEEKMQIAGS